MRPEGCKCDFRTYMVGDGCQYCNPRLHEELAKELREREPADDREKFEDE